MNTRWRKIAGDLRQHRAQIFIVLLVLVVGATGVVAALNAHAVLQREIDSSYRRSSSPDLAFWFEKVEPRLLDLVRAQPGVADADARRVINTKVLGKRVGDWLPMRLVVVNDLAEQRVGVVHQHGGEHWPEGNAGLLIEQSSMPLLSQTLGDAVRVRLPGGGEVSMPISGIVHDTAVAPGYMERLVYAYCTPAVAARLGQDQMLDQLVVMADERSHVAPLSSALQAMLAANDAAPLRAEVLRNVHPHAQLMSALLWLLRSFAVMGFVCSAALAVFVVSLWMKRETRQVGIMKTLGARTHQLAFQYLALVGPLVALATGIALVAGTALGNWLINDTALEQNIDIGRWSVPRGLLLMEVLCTIGIPLIAMALPIFRAARMSAREAIQDAGITAPVNGSRLARFIKLPGDQRWTFALRNTVRRKWRLAFTVTGLALGGAVLLTAVNYYKSLMGVIDAVVEDRGHDLHVVLQRPIEPAKLEEIARDIPGVAIAEAWRRAGVEIVRGGAGGPVTSHEAEAGGHAGARTSVSAQLFGHPADTHLPRLTIQEGRWPEPGEASAVVATRPLQRRVPGVNVGSEVTLQLREQRTTVRVVGLVDEISTRAFYTDAPTFEAITGVRDLASELRVRAVDRNDLDPIVAAVDQALLDERLAAGPIVTRWGIRESYDEHFRDFVTLCVIVSVATALVGAMCLIAFACLNVLKRAREIGVLRTIGAAPRDVMRMFMAESGMIVGSSLVIGVGISFPASVAFNDFTSSFALLIPIPLVFSWGALVAVCAGVPVVMLGVWVAIARMLRLSVRDTLAYE
jgi:putative ABC transport system permease protein